MTSTMKWTMISLALGAFGAIGCSTTTTCDDAGNNCTTTGSTTTAGSTTGTTTAGSTTGTTTAGSTTGTTTAGSTTGTTTAGSTTGTTTAGSTTGTTTAGTTTSGSTTGAFMTYFDGGCWVTPTYDPNATNAQLMNGCTSSQGVALGVSSLPCWDGGVTATSNLPADFVTAGFVPGAANGITCPTN